MNLYLANNSSDGTSIVETIYWLELLHATSYIPQEEMLKMKTDAEELMKILRSIIITAKRNLSN